MTALAVSVAINIFCWG